MFKLLRILRARRMWTQNRLSTQYFHDCAPLHLLALCRACSRMSMVHGFWAWPFAEQRSDNWFAQQNIHLSDPLAEEVYLFIVRRAVACAWGRFGPQTLTIEVWFAVTAVIIGAVIFAVVLGNVTILIDNISKAESAFQEAFHDTARKLDRLSKCRTP